MNIAGGIAENKQGDLLKIIKETEIDYIKRTIKKLRYFNHNLERNDKPIPRHATGTYRLEREFCAQFIPVKEYIERGCQESVLTTMFIDVYGFDAMNDIAFYSAFKENINRLAEIIQNKIKI